MRPRRDESRNDPSGSIKRSSFDLIVEEFLDPVFIVRHCQTIMLNVSSRIFNWIVSHERDSSHPIPSDLFSVYHSV